MMLIVAQILIMAVVAMAKETTVTVVTANIITRRPTTTRPTQIFGGFSPRLEENGEYAAHQFSGSTGYEWCVTKSGEKIEGTEGPSWGRKYKLDCEMERKKHAQKTANKAETKCEKVRREETPDSNKLVFGRYIPQCDSNGEYKAKQSHGSTGSDWCVTESGEEIENTRGQPWMRPRGFQLDCDKARKEHGQRQNGKCARERRSDQESHDKQVKETGHPVFGFSLPDCDSEGNYKKLQSRLYYSWCVDKETGEEIKGTGMDGSNRNYMEESRCLPQTYTAVLPPVTLKDAKSNDLNTLLQNVIGDLL